MANLLLIPSQFAIGMIGQQIDNSVFNFRVTSDGRYVCDPSEQDLFPLNFAALIDSGWSVVLLDLSDKDFPQPTGVI